MEDTNKYQDQRQGERDNMLLGGGCGTQPHPAAPSCGPVLTMGGVAADRMRAREQDLAKAVHEPIYNTILHRASRAFQDADKYRALLDRMEQTPGSGEMLEIIQQAILMGLIRL